MRKSWSTTTDNWLPSSRTFVRRFTSRNSSLSRNLNCKKKNGASTRNNWKMSGAWIGFVATQTSLRPKSNSLKSGNKLYNCGLIFFSWQLRHLNTFSSCKVHTIERDGEEWQRNRDKRCVRCLCCRDFKVRFVYSRAHRERHPAVNPATDFRSDPNTWDGSAWRSCVAPAPRLSYRPN